MPLIFSDFFQKKKKKMLFFHSNLCQQGAVNITHWAFDFFFYRKHKNKTYNTTRSKSFCLSDSWCHTMFDRQLPQSLSPSACSHTSQFPLWSKAMWIHTFTSLLSLTPLRLVRGRVNPLLSRTHAAPIHRGSAQNARVQLCGTARSAGWEETRKWVTGQVTAHFSFLFFFLREGSWQWCEHLIWVSIQHRNRKHDSWPGSVAHNTSTSVWTASNNLSVCRGGRSNSEQKLGTTEGVEQGVGWFQLNSNDITCKELWE